MHYLPAIKHSIIFETVRSKRFIAVCLLYFVIVSFVFLQVTQAFFTDSASSTNNSFSAANEFPPLTAPVASIVINEVFQATTNPPEWIELYNTTGAAIDVSGWKVSDNTDTDTFPTTSPIPANGYAVVVPTSSTAVVPASAITIILSNATIGSGLTAGGDRVILKNSSDIEVDKMSWGSDTTAGFPTPLPTPPAGSSFARNPNGADTNSNADWQLDDSPSIGVSN